MQPSFVEIPMSVKNEKRLPAVKKESLAETVSSSSAKITVGLISIEIQENASADFIKKLIEAVSHA